jgi:RNA polymerase sigma-70 factor (ECF subfamily)
MVSCAANDRASSSPQLDETAALCNDASFLVRLQAGDSLAYETLVRQQGPRMLAIAKRFFQCEQDAADSVQDAFLAAFRAIPNFKGESQLGTWLYRIVVNSCLMRRRSKDRHPTVAIETLLPGFDETGHHRQSVKAFRDSPSDALAAAELRQHVRECIDCLPASYREALILRDIEELDTETTAATLGVSSGVVKTRLHRARQALCTLLQPICQPV